MACHDIANQEWKYQVLSVEVFPFVVGLWLDSICKREKGKTRSQIDEKKKDTSRQHDHIETGHQFEERERKHKSEGGRSRLEMQNVVFIFIYVPLKRAIYQEGFQISFIYSFVESDSMLP